MRIGYQVISKDKFKLVPVFGLAASYNISYKKKLESNQRDFGGYKETNYLGNGMARISAWGCVGAELQFVLSTRSTIVINPEASYMLTSFNTKGPNKHHVMIAGISAGYRLSF